MPPLVFDIFGFLGFLFSALGFLIFGFGAGKFTFSAYEKAVWQVQIALALGFFGMLIGIANFTSPGSTGMFVLGAGIALIMAGRPPKAEDKE
ncbi:MAG: hypothetical protein Kow002_04930 [Anaerolineales bacterium]